MKKKHLGMLVRLAGSLVLILILLTVVSRDTASHRSLSVDPAYYALGLLAYLVMVGFWALRWYLFIRAAGEPVGYGRALLVLLRGLFYSLFLPSMVGTDVGRMVELGRSKNTSRSNAVSTVLLDRLMGLITLCLMAGVALVLGSRYAGNQGVKGLVIGVLVILIVGWAIFFNRPIMEAVFRIIFRLPIVNRLETAIRKTYEALFHLHDRPRLLFMVGNVSLLNTVSETLAAFFAAQALGVRVEPVHFFIFMPLIWLITIVPISISGLGLREGAFVFFFTQVGVSSADAVAISLLFYSFSVLVGLTGGFLLLAMSLREYFQTLARQHAA